MRKEVLAAIAAVLALWFFVMGFEIGVYKERKANAEAMAGMNPPAVSTQPTNNNLPTAPTQSVTPTTPGNNMTAPSANLPTVAPTEAPQSGNELNNLSTDEIVTTVGNAINALKQTQNFTAVKRLQVVVKVVDCSVPSAVEKINEIITDVTAKAEPEETLVFTNGVAVNSKGEQVAASVEVPPAKNNFTLTAAGVASARAEKQGDNTVYYINVVPESTTAENPIPVHNSGSVGFLNVTDLGLPSIVNITKADMNYPASTITATLDKDGKVIYLKNYLPMTGGGEAKVMGIGGSAQFEGYLDEEWTITY